MIQVSDETKQAFLTDSTNKQVVIEFQGEEYDYDELNYFVGDIWSESGYGSTFRNPISQYIDLRGEDWGHKDTTITFLFSKNSISDSNIQKCIDTKEIFKYDYWYFSTAIKIKEWREGYPWTKPVIGNLNLNIELGYVENGVSKQIIQPIEYYQQMADDLADGNFWVRINIPKFCKKFDSNNYIDYLKFNLTFYTFNYSYCYAEYKAYKTMFTVSDTPPESYEYPDYFESQIKNGVYPLRKTISDNVTNENIISESITYVDSICSQENIKFGLAESSYVKFSVADRNENFKNSVFKATVTCDDTEPIDLGIFKVTEVKKKHSYNLLTQELTAYDESIDWNKDVSDWFSKYLWGVNFKKDSNTDALPYFSRTSKSWDFTRQMFSTFYNFAYFIGVLNFDDADWQDIYISKEENKYYYYYWGDTKSGSRQQRRCIRTTKTNPNTSKLYRIGYKINPILYALNETDLYPYEVPEDTRWHLVNMDNQNTIGGASRGSIFIVETLSDGTYNKFVVDAGDCFVLSPNCTSIDFFTPADYGDYYPPQTYPYYQLRGIYSYAIYLNYCDAPDWVFTLRNRATRLVYYDWEKTKYYDGGGTNVKCTIKDVMRSLFEINGAFVKIGRDGNLKIKIPTKSILYPSETLYPSEELYPAAEEQHQYVPMSKYISFEYEDYNTADFGTIQIKSKKPEGQTVKTYIGDENKDSAYIIDNNIFYSNEFVKFDYDASGQVAYDVLPEVTQMMKNLYIAIAGLDYRPHTTDAKGMPWVEAGDRLTLITNQSAVESFIFRRTLKGIQALRDTFEASGEDVIAMQDDNTKGE